MSMYSDQQFSEKPGKAQAIAIMTLVNGILNILWGISVAFGFFIGAFGTFGFALCCLPISLYPIGVGIFEIISATKLLGNPPRKFDVKTIAILEIVNIVVLAVPSLVVGILNLVFYNEPDVRTYIDSLPS